MAKAKRITGYTGDLSDVTIPSYIDDSLVRFIANEAFKDTEVERICIPYRGLYEGAPWGSTAFINFKTKNGGTWEDAVKVSETLKLSQSVECIKENNILSIY